MTPGELRAFLRHVDEAMETEGCPAHERERVINRVIFGHPEGYQHPADPGQQEMLPGPWPEEGDHAVALAQQAPIFRHDGREVAGDWVPGEENYPLMGTCRCGRQVLQERNDAPWLHCD